MINYNNGMPAYWRDETSGKMEDAVWEYFDPYANPEQDPEKITEIPELTNQSLALLKRYILHWANAPCYRHNPSATPEHMAELGKAIALAEKIEGRSDINKALAALMHLGIDPF